jgi:hypothetical protein
MNDENPNEDSYENDFSDDDIKTKRSKSSRSYSSKESLRSYEKEYDRSPKMRHHSTEKYHLDSNKNKKNNKLQLDLDYMSDEEFNHKRDQRKREDKPLKNHNYDDEISPRRERHHSHNKLEIDDEINRRINALLSREKPQSNRNFDDYDKNYSHQKNNKPFRDIDMTNRDNSMLSYNQPRIRVK